MHVLNIHEREIPATTAEVGALLDSLASDRDALWPKKTWTPMFLDRPLGVGASGGHGPVRYAVEEFTPGQMVKFRFSAPRGFDGYHRFEILPQGQDRAILRHTIDMNARGPALLTWPLVFRPLHDALLEDLLALALASVGAIPLVRPWSPGVKFLRWVLSGGKVRKQQTPKPKVRGTLRDEGTQHP